MPRRSSPTPLEVAFAFGGPTHPYAQVESEIPCRRCAYNLHGLKLIGRCPECNTPVIVSTQGNLLRYSDPYWLAMLALGMRFIFWGVIVSFFVGNAFQKLEFFCDLPAMIGAWLITQPDPSGLGERQYARSRNLVRITLAIGLAGSLFRSCATYFPTSKVIPQLLTPVTICTGIVEIVGLFVMLTYLEKLAARMPDPFLVNRAGFLRWAYAFVLGAVLLLGRFLPQTQRPIDRLVTLVILAGLIAFGILLLSFYSRLRRELLVQAEMATLIWGTVD